MDINERVILGIDPGTTIMGYGIISTIGSSISLVTYDILCLDKIDDHYLKLKKIFETVCNLIEVYHPDELSIEAPFFGKNVQSMLKLGRAQGVAIAAAMSKTIPAHEYSPKKIKQSITGNGNASKEQVAYMLKNLFKIDEFHTTKLDATDALAAAVCHSYQYKMSFGSSTQKITGWKSFIQQNPERKA